MTHPTRTPLAHHIPPARMVDSGSWIRQSNDYSCLQVSSLGHGGRTGVRQRDTHDGMQGASYYPPSSPPHADSYSHPYGPSRSVPPEAAYHHGPSSYGASSHYFPPEQYAVNQNEFSSYRPPPNFSTYAAYHPQPLSYGPPRSPMPDQYAAYRRDVPYVLHSVQGGAPAAHQHDRPGACSDQSVERRNGDIRNLVAELQVNLVAAGKEHCFVMRTPSSHAPEDSACASPSYAYSNSEPSKDHNAATHLAVCVLENGEAPKYTISERSATAGRVQGDSSRWSILKSSKSCADRRHRRSAHSACKSTQCKNGNASKCDPYEQSPRDAGIAALPAVARTASFMCDPVHQLICVAPKPGQYSKPEVYMLFDSSELANASHVSSTGSGTTFLPLETSRTSEATLPPALQVRTADVHLYDDDDSRYDIEYNALCRSVQVSRRKAHLPDALRTQKMDDTEKASSMETISSGHTTASMLIDSLITGMSPDELKSTERTSLLLGNVSSAYTTHATMKTDLLETYLVEPVQSGLQLASTLLELKHTGEVLQGTEQQFHNWASFSTPNLRKASKTLEIAFPGLQREEIHAISLDDAQARTGCINRDAFEGKMAGRAGVHNGGIPTKPADGHYKKDNGDDGNREHADSGRVSACDRDIGDVPPELTLCNVDTVGTSVKAGLGAESPKKLRTCLSPGRAYSPNSNKRCKSVTIASESQTSALLLASKLDCLSLGLPHNDERECPRVIQVPYSPSSTFDTVFVESVEDKSNTSANLLASTLKSVERAYSVTPGQTVDLSLAEPRDSLSSGCTVNNKIPEDHAVYRTLCASECYPAGSSRACSGINSKMPEDRATYRALCASEYHNSNPLASFFPSVLSDPPCTPVWSGVISTRPFPTLELPEDPACSSPCCKESASLVAADGVHAHDDTSFPMHIARKSLESDRTIERLVSRGEPRSAPSSFSLDHARLTHSKSSSCPETKVSAAAPPDVEAVYNGNNSGRNDDIIVRAMDLLVAMNNRALFEQKEQLSELRQGRKCIEIEARNLKRLENEIKAWRGEMQAHVRLLEGRVTNLEEHHRDKHKTTMS